MSTERSSGLWESVLGAWAQGPGQSEEERCENAVRQIRSAVEKSEHLKHRSIHVFVHGSYRNNVNVRQDSDVDVGVLCDDVFIPRYPSGTTRETFGNSRSDYSYSQYKNEVEKALVAYFGSDAVVRGNKAFDIRENTYRVDADVAAFFEHRRYQTDGSFLTGVALRPDSGGLVINWPEQHYNNGVRKNSATNRRFKRIVRIVKRLRNEMDDKGVRAASTVPGFLVECLVWNVPNGYLTRQGYTASVRAALAHIFNNTMTEEQCREWGEVSELKYLFRSGQPWTRQEAHAFVDAAWNYVGLQ
jgi:hypothetical protein